MNQSKVILLVENDDLDVISVKRSISKMENKPHLVTAYNGLEALQMLRGENQPKVKPDIIILDLNMPKMNGIEFLSELRKHAEFDDIRVYIMTTSNEESDRSATEKYNISGYYIKPLEFNDNIKKTSSMDNFMHFQLLKILGEMPTELQS